MGGEGGGKGGGLGGGGDGGGEGGLGGGEGNTSSIAHILRSEMIASTSGQASWPRLGLRDHRASISSIRIRSPGNSRSPYALNELEPICW